MTPAWQLFAAAFVGGFFGAAGRDLARLVLRSDWVTWAIIRADFRAIGRAQRKAARRGKGTRRTPGRNA